jgi:hypothetical protein
MYCLGVLGNFPSESKSAFLPWYHAPAPHSWTQPHTQALSSMLFPGVELGLVLLHWTDVYISMNWRVYKINDLDFKCLKTSRGH